MDKGLFDDLITSCEEVIEYKKGNIGLKTTTLDIPDDEIFFYSTYKKLSEQNKQKAICYVNELLKASSG
jgi:hypothetical protein